MKIGILQEGNRLNHYQDDILKYLHKQKILDIVLIYIEKDNETVLEKLRRKLKDKSLYNIISDIIFNCYIKAECIIVGLYDNQIQIKSKEYTLQKEIFKKIVYVRGYMGRYNSFYLSEDSIIKIRQLNLDILYRCSGGGIYKGGILEASRIGIISLHHGDNRWNRGGPPGFWEVFLRKIYTGFILQILNNNIDGGKVILRGQIRTKPIYTLNMHSIYEYSNIYVKQLFQKIDSFDDKIGNEFNYIYDYTIFKHPCFINLLKYIYKISNFYLSKIYRRHILRKKHNWQIGVQFRTWKGSNLSKSIKINPPKGKFYADPFMVKYENKYVIFYENYDYNKKIGAISCSLIDKDKGIVKQYNNIIGSSTHLSYPFVFEYNSKLYLIPESREEKSIQIFECCKFPHKWIKIRNIFEDIYAVDSMVFFQNKLWWLLTTIAPNPNAKADSELHIFYTSNDPIRGKWIKHKNNPIINDPLSGRSGGLLRSNDKIYRVNQKPGYAQYGKSVVINELECKKEFISQKFIQNISPNFFHNAIGIHHISGNDDFFCFDYEVQ